MDGRNKNKGENRHVGVKCERTTLKVLVFHPMIAPYRIAFFNAIYNTFQTDIYLYEKNIEDNKFDYESLKKQFDFEPNFLNKGKKLLGRNVYMGHKNILKEKDPDIVIVGEYGEALWISVLYRCLHNKHYRIISICDDSRTMAENCGGLRRISRALMLNKIDGLLLCNDGAKEWYSYEKQHPNSFVFPIIQNEREFRRNEGAIAEKASKHIKENNLIGKRVFLFVGRLIPEKNIEYLIESFITQHGKHPENILFIIGGESYKDVGFRRRMEDKIQVADGESYIRFLGRIEGEDLKSWFFAAQVFVLPSIYEAFGAVVNEALLSGEYVMVSNKAGAACLVNNDNGEILDVSKEYIDFEKVCGKIKPLSEYKTRDSKMPFTFRKKMDDLLHWIEEL